MNLAIIIIYLVCMIGIGIYVFLRRQTSSIDGFFVANRSGNTPLILGSLCATVIGASVVVMMAGLGYGWGLPGAWWLLIGAVGLLVLGLFFAKKVRQVGLYTLPELVEKQYGAAAGLAASVLIIIGWTGIIAAQILAAGAILGAILPYDDSLLMAIAAGVFVLYTVLGGQYSVIRTDIAQFIILVIGILIALGYVLVKVNDEGGLTANLPDYYFSFPVNEKFDWEKIITWLILFGSTYVVGPDIYARLFSARDGQTAKKSALIAAIIIIPIAFVIVLIGMGVMALGLDIGGKWDNVFPTVISDILPTGVGGLVAVGLLAAIMSSADTLLLTTSTIISQDIYGRFIQEMGEHRNLIISRISVFIMGALALIIALLLEGIIDSLKLAYTVFTSGVVVPVIAGFYKDKLKVNSIGAMAAIVGGGGTALVINRLDHYDKLGGVEHLDLVGVGVCIVLLFGVSWITKLTGLAVEESID